MSRLRNIALATLPLGIAAIILIIYHVGFREIIKLLSNASVVFIICFLAVSLLIAMVLTFKWKLILHAKGIEVPYWRLFSYRLVGYSVSYLTPTAHVGGEPIRAYLLKREGVGINTGFSSVIIDRTVEVTTDVTFFFIGALVVISSVAVANSVKIILLSVSLSLILLLVLFIGGILLRKNVFLRIFRTLQLHRFKRLRPVENNLLQIEREVEQFYRTKRNYFLAILGIMVVLWSLMFLEYRFALLIFGHIATPMQIFLILTGVGIAYSLPVPAALGALELSSLSAVKVLGLEGAIAIALSFLIRARDVAWTILGLIFLSFYEMNFEKLKAEHIRLEESVLPK